jgi:hypothetical protein
MTKKIVLWSSGVISFIILILNYVGTYNLCRVQNGGVKFLDTLSSLFTYGCTDFLYDIIIIFEIFLPLFLLSLITYKMRDEIFRTWMKFTYVWVPLTLILVFIAPEYQNSWLPIYEKGFVSFVMSFLFLLISLILIIVRHISLKKTTFQK